MSGTIQPGDLVTSGITANDPTTTATAGKVYYPMMRVLYTPDGGYLNPTAVPTDPIEPWPIRIEVQKSWWHHADRFQCEFPLFADEAFSYTFWGQLDRMIVSVEVSFDEATSEGRTAFIPWTPLIRGIVDVVSADVRKGVVSIRGRSVDSVFGDTRYNDSMFNESVHDTVERLADGHGFETDIDDNGEIHGRIWGDDKDHSTLGIMSREINERDMLSRLANQFGYAFWLSPDATFHFKKKPLEGAVWFINCPTPDFLAPGVDRHKPSNFDQIKFEHNLIWSDLGARLTVNGYDVLGKEMKYSVFPEEGEDARVFVALSEQTSQEDVEAVAASTHSTIVGREWTLDATIADPTWVNFDIIDNINVQGTNSTFDGPYLLDVITYRLDARHGWSTNVKGKVGKPTGDIGAGDVGNG